MDLDFKQILPLIPQGQLYETVIQNDGEAGRKF
jgi:hypothetical protein